METSGTNERVGANDPAELVSVARNFFTFAFLVVVVAVPLIHRYEGRQSMIVVWSAGIAGLAGWASTSAIRNRAKLPSRDIGLTGRFVENWGALAIFVAFLALYSSTMLPPTPFNAHVLQALAFIHGRTWIDVPPCCIEHALYNGHYYQLHPPLPAILVLPFAAIWGNDTNQTAVCVMIGAISVALAWIMLGRMKVTLNGRVWLTIFFGVGTILWHESVDGGSWEL